MYTTITTQQLSTLQFTPVQFFKEDEDVKNIRTAIENSLIYPDKLNSLKNLPILPTLNDQDFWKWEEGSKHYTQADLERAYNNIEEEAYLTEMQIDQLKETESYDNGIDDYYQSSTLLRALEQFKQLQTLSTFLIIQLA
jgi:hypothetical protein